MNKSLFKVFSLITILALLLMAVPMQSAQAISGYCISQVMVAWETHLHSRFHTTRHIGEHVSFTIWLVNSNMQSANGTGGLGTGSSNPDHYLC